MTIYNPNSSASPFMNDDGNTVRYVDKAVVAAALAIGDKVRLVKIAGGTKVDRVTINNGDLDTGTNTLAASIGFEYVDGSSGMNQTEVAAAGANALTGAANTVYDIWPPVTLEREAYLTILCTTASNALAAPATVYGKVEGENIGEK